MPFKLIQLNTAPPAALDSILSPYFIEKDYDTLKSFGFTQSSLYELENYRSKNQSLSPLIDWMIENNFNPEKELDIPGDTAKLVFTKDASGKIYNPGSIEVGYDIGGPVVQESIQGPGGILGPIQISAVSKASLSGAIKYNPVFGSVKTAPALNRYMTLWNSYGGFGSQIFSFLHGGSTTTQNSISNAIKQIGKEYPRKIEQALQDAGYNRGVLDIAGKLPFGSATVSNSWYFGMKSNILFGVWWGFPWEEYIPWQKSGEPVPEGATSANFFPSTYNRPDKAQVPKTIANLTLDERKYIYWWLSDRYGEDPYFAFAETTAPPEERKQNIYRGYKPVVEFPNCLKNSKLDPLKHPIGVYEKTGEPDDAVEYIVDIHMHFQAIAEWIEEGCPCDWPEWGGYTDAITEAQNNEQERINVADANKYIPATTISASPPLNPKFGDLWTDSTTNRIKVFVRIDDTYGTWVDN